MIFRAHMLCVVRPRPHSQWYQNTHAYIFVHKEFKNLFLYIFAFSLAGIYAVILLVLKIILLRRQFEWVYFWKFYSSSFNRNINKQFYLHLKCINKIKKISFYF